VTVTALPKRAAALPQGRLLAAVALVILSGAAIGFFFAADYVWADRLFGHYLGIAACAWLLGGFLVARATRHLTRVAIPFTILFVTSSVLLLIGGGLIALMDSAREVVGVATSPDRRFTAVVTAEPSPIDTVYRVTIRQEAGLLARKWSAGCLHGDNHANGYDSMRWTGPSTLTLRTGDGRELVLRTDPSTGRPRNVVSAGITDLCT
jgi:hypothetical protein